MNTRKGTTKTRKKATKFKETITKKGMTTTEKRAIIQGYDHQEGDN
jgi:hypothetical protein